MCFFAGGLRYQEQGFGAGMVQFEFFMQLNRLPSGAIQLNSSLLTLSVIAVLLPAAFHFVAGDQISDDVEGADILAVSRGVSALHFEFR